MTVDDDSAPPALVLGGIDALGHAMAVVDERDDRLIWCSAAWQTRMPGLGRHGSVAGTSWSQALAMQPDLAELWERAQQGQSATGRIRDERDSSPARLDICAMAEGQYVLQLHQGLSTVDDMRQYMQAREHLFTTSRTISVSEMATTLAHEIRQPIATISNILRGVRMRLSRGDVSHEKIDEALDKALSQAQFTNSIISRIRDFTEARRPKQQSVDICELIRESLGLMDWLFSHNQCQLALELPKTPLYCNGDRTMLQQVLVNLLRNAVESMQDRHSSGRLIRILVREQGDSLRIGIHDQGHGLKGKEDTLFVPFATDKASGMGVGLNICRSFIELHQGRLWLAQNDAGGCTSWIELPMDLPAQGGEGLPVVVDELRASEVSGLDTKPVETETRGQAHHG